MSVATMDLRLNAGTKIAFQTAQAIAKEYMHAEFGAAHLLKALMHEDLGLEQQLWQMDYDVYYIDEWADVRLESCRKAFAPRETVNGDQSVPGLLDEADNIRMQLNEEEIIPMHLLIALTTPGTGFSFEQLKTFPLQRDLLLQQEGEKASFRQMVNGKDNENLNGRDERKTGSAAGGQALLKFCRDKGVQAAAGGMDPITGREQELRMMAEILSRRSKPNVLLIGDPGVGKSALVDGFSLAIHNGQVPAFLLGAKLFELDNGALVAGASYKGEVEERLKSILKEIGQYDKAILFIDEMHVLLDKQGSAAGAANLLKPELARGAITVIGATTLEEYRKHIEKDEAFARRFETLTVPEPDAETAFRMMKTVIPRYEAHHRVAVDEETMKEAVRLAKRYIKDRKLPDAAIDLVDRSMAALRLAIDTGEGSREILLQEFGRLEKSDEPISSGEWRWHFGQIKRAISPLIRTAAAVPEDLEDIQDASLLQKEIEAIYQRLESLLPLTRTALHKQDIMSIVADKTGIPVGRLQTQEKERLLNIPALLRERVVGQEQAIHAISEAILESRSGLSKPGQPIGSFFFLGPTGTGKTELARALAELLFQDERFMIRFDMSEFKEEHAAALLYGAPPGYVGYEEGGLLVNKIRQQPYAVVLFDEIEKAHASVFDIFLQIMDEGRLHDKLGREGDFSNALIIFTSNIASQQVVEAFGRGEIPSNTDLLERMTAHFRPEFLGRLTEIVPFGPINPDMVERIFNIQVKGLYQSLAGQGIGLHITPEAARWIATKGYSPDYGARPLAGVIRGQIRKPLSRMIISGEIAHGSHVQLDLGPDGRLNWTHGAGGSK